MINKKIDKFGNVIIHGDDAYKLLYMGRKLNFNLTETPDVKLFNDTLRYFSNEYQLSTYEEPNLSLDEFHAIKSKEWFLPKEYENLNIREYLYSKINSNQEKERIDFELKLFEKNSLINVLKTIIFLVDVMKNNKIVWGVGRGSSVASFILYVIGLHKVNPLLYDIPIDEFFKEEK